MAGNEGCDLRAKFLFQLFGRGFSVICGVMEYGGSHRCRAQTYFIGGDPGNLQGMSDSRSSIIFLMDLQGKFKCLPDDTQLLLFNKRFT